ncbi:MAG: SIS domain-containing protein, partial [Acidimicrobiia bacterium]|nr:SIS domain-containing protein [Acidimicrobiia bacterium]
MTMYDEILQQPDVVARLLENNAPTFQRLAPFVAGSSYALIAARGTSDNAARYAQYAWGARNRLSVGLAAPSLFGPYAGPPSLESAAVVGISQSGESPDLIAVLSEARRQGRPTLTITNHPDSPLASESDHVIDLCAGEERAVA